MPGKRVLSGPDNDPASLLPGCVSKCVAVCCSVLQCVAVCRNVWQCVAVCRISLQCVAVCCSCSVLQSVAVCCNVPLLHLFLAVVPRMCVWKCMCVWEWCLYVCESDAYVCVRVMPICVCESDAYVREREWCLYVWESQVYTRVRVMPICVCASEACYVWSPMIHIHHTHTHKLHAQSEIARGMPHMCVRVCVWESNAYHVWLPMIISATDLSVKMCVCVAHRCGAARVW